MNIQDLVDMSDEDYAEAVSQAAKGRRDFPEWWRLVLHPDLIDATEQALLDARSSAERQALTPERYPAAASFARKMGGLLMEIRLTRAARGEG